MDEPLLAGCWAKHGRAVEHLETLKRAIDEFAERKPHVFEAEIDREASAYIARLNVREEPDEFAWGLLLGDFAHNCRAALDHLVWQLVRLNGKTPQGNIQFPICSSGERYWSRRKNGRPSMRDEYLAGVAEQHRAGIDAMQPYRAGHNAAAHELAILAWFSNTDKHQVIHTTRMAIENPNPSKFRINVNEDVAGGAGTVTYTSGHLKHGAEVFRMPIEIIGEDPQVQVEAEASIGIGFGERAIRGEVLPRIARFVEIILRNYDELVFKAE